MGCFTSLYTSELPHRPIAVFIFLRDCIAMVGKCYQAIGAVARDLKLSRSTVKHALADLEKAAGCGKNKDGGKTGVRVATCFI